MFVRRLIALLMLFAAGAVAHDRPIQGEALSDYIQRMQQPAFEAKPASPGSLWNDNGQFARLSADYKAARRTALPSLMARPDVPAKPKASSAVKAQRPAKSEEEPEAVEK